MFQMITGYWVSQTVGALAKLGVCDQFTDTPRTAGEVAPEVGADPGALFRVLRAAATLGVFEHHEGDRFSLTPVGETLKSDVPGSMRKMAIAQTSPGHWLPWGRFTDAVKSGTEQASKAHGKPIFEYYDGVDEERVAFMGAMQDMSMMVASEFARLVDFSDCKVVADIGGAGGALLGAVLDENPDVTGILYDLPSVSGDAKGAVAARGHVDRCEVVGGDFFKSVPAGADVYLLKHILHDWNDEQSVTILKNVAKGMKASSKVYLVEMVIPDDNTPSAAQMMDLNMLAMLPGRERTQQEYASLLEAAGLKFTSLIRTHSPFQIVEASLA
ncbi:MAG: hypothetical protein ACI9KE_000701 [Polyangiales bacterium]|jgi:hypothetical protein